MLIRIAPEMFSDERYECTTIIDVKNEIYRTQRFKGKFPWRKDYKDKIRTLGATKLETEEYKENYRLVKNLLNNYILNEDTGQHIDLSLVDRKIAAYVITNKCKVSTGDKNLAAFITQQFDIENLKPLEIINEWIEGDLIEANEDLLKYLQDWIDNDEPIQPKEAIKKFEEITGLKFPK